MRKILLMTLLLLVFFWGGVFSQDDIYGDYLIDSVESKVSLELEGAQLTDVLKLFSQQTGLNFISTEEIKKRTLTLYMKDVPMKGAMDIIFKANNLTYNYYPESNLFVVKEVSKPEIELKTKIYNLQYARVTNSKLEQHLGSMVDGMLEEEGDGGDSSDAGSGGGIKSAVEAVLTEVKGADVVEDAATNSLIVVDIPSQFPMIDQLIAKLDVAPIKVMIEVEMLDVSKSRLDQIGFNFASGATASFTPGSRQTTFPWFDKFSGQSAGGASPTLSALSLASFTTVMKFLTQDTATKFIARPKILTLDNETAEINLTLNEIIGLTTTTNEDGTVTQEIEREDTGTRLRVTPKSNISTGEVTLVVEVFNRESVDSNIAVTGMSSGFVKNVEERGTKSVVRLKNGETLFIGGLIKKKESETISKIPFLGSIPILGKIFSYKNKPSTDNLNRELLVFLTPSILEESGVLSKKGKAIFREQQNSSKDSSMKVALDNYK